jgi:hypothetical protein
MAIFGRKESSSGSSGEIRDLEGKQQYGNGKEPIATFTDTEEGILQPSDDPRNRLHRGLHARQIGMIAIGKLNIVTPVCLWFVEVLHQFLQEYLWLFVEELESGYMASDSGKSHARKDHSWTRR